MTSKKSTARKGSYAFLPKILPKIIPEASKNSSPGKFPLKLLPISNKRRSKIPLSWFLLAAIRRPGIIEGLISVISELIGFEINACVFPSLKSSALALSRKLYVIHSSYPSIVKARRNLETLRCIFVKMGLGTPSPFFSNGFPSKFLSDITRDISSRRSISPIMSGLQLGILTS